MTRPVLALALALALPFLLPAAPASGQRVDSERADSERAQFGICSGSGRVTCVVDGDTIWYRGDKIRLADINTPEISQPACAGEARLGAEARDRLAELLNAAAFSLETDGRAVDRYGRLLRVVTRNGTSLGDMLVAEGLAEQWQGRRSGWCDGDAGGEVLGG